MEKIIIQGIKYDAKSSFLQGAADAPEIIREVLNNGSSNYNAEDGREINNSIVYDLGDFVIQEYHDIYDITKSNVSSNGGKVLTLGGDHSITYPIVKALVELYGSFHVLHIDAHADLYHIFEGDKYSHACPFARIMEEDLVLSLTQAGIRTLNTHQSKQAKKYGVVIHEMKDWGKENLTLLGPLYISLDMDAFDPAFAPGVSHYEPGGFSARQVIEMIQKIEVEIIGADIVEYNPMRDTNKMTAVLASKMMKEILSKMLCN